MWPASATRLRLWQNCALPIVSVDAKRNVNHVPRVATFPPLGGGAPLTVAICGRMAQGKRRACGADSVISLCKACLNKAAVAARRDRGSAVAQTVDARSFTNSRDTTGGNWHVRRTVQKDRLDQSSHRMNRSRTKKATDESPTTPHSPPKVDPRSS